MTLISELLEDLEAESAEVDGLVSALTGKQWATPTPAPGWTVAHQISHLAWVDELACRSATRPDEFSAELSDEVGETRSLTDCGDTLVAAGIAAGPGPLLARWRHGRAQLGVAIALVPDGMRLPWMGPPMSRASMVTARLMETWAHGLDIADGLGIRRQPSARLRHVAHLGVRARGFAFMTNGRRAPDSAVRVELVAPDGGMWTWGPRDARERVTGSALDFCYRVTQRRHRDDLDLIAVGAIANEWLDIAQAFAGPPGAGRPSTRARSGAAQLGP